MKNYLIALLLSLFFLPCFSQNLNFDVHGRYSRSVTKETLSNAKLLRDFVPGYPVNWISNYISVEIIAINAGKEKKGLGSNETLTSAQKNILNKVDLSSDITINIKYKYKNTVTNIFEDNVASILITAIPEIEAEYIGGRQELNKYLHEKVPNNISASSVPGWLAIPVQRPVGKVTFAVNEKGEIIDIKLSKSTGDSKTDFLLLDAIYKMPKWKPAETSNGIKVRQEFVFSYGNDGC